MAGEGPGTREGQEGRGRGRAGRRAAAAKGQGKVVRLGGPRVLFNALFGVDPSVPNDDVLGTIPQALFLMNSPHGQQPDAGPAGDRARRDPRATAPTTAPPSTPSTSASSSRQPTAKEVEACGRYLDQVGNRREAFEDISGA